jgi:hypothetical protein
MTDIRISTAGRLLSAATPYHPQLPASARRPGGKWDKRAWDLAGRLFNDLPSDAVIEVIEPTAHERLAMVAASGSVA